MVLDTKDQGADDIAAVEVSVLEPESLLLGVAHQMMRMSKTVAKTPMMIIILRFFHQYLRFSLVACCSNWLAPCWRASALVSSSDSFWSRSSTFWTLTRIMPTTSLTWSCVCWRARLSELTRPDDPCSSMVILQQLYRRVNAPMVVNTPLNERNRQQNGVKLTSLDGSALMILMVARI